MWLKVHYPVHFMASVLTSWMGKKMEEIIPYLNESRRMEIDILPPDINHSSSRFEPSKDTRGIHFGLVGIDGVGKIAVENILEIKERHEIRTLSDFILLTGSAVNKTVVVALIKCGAFDFLGQNRATLLKAAEELIALHAKVKTKIAGNKKRKTPVADVSVFYETLYAYQIEEVPEFSYEDLCQMERELTGFYMKHHPLSGLIDYLRSKSTHTSTQLLKGDLRHEAEDEHDEDIYEPIPAGQTVITGGVVKSLKEIVLKKGRNKGKVMASFTLEDSYQGEIQCTAFVETYKAFQNLLAQGNVVMIQGQLDYYQGNPQLLVKKVGPVNRQAIVSREEAQVLRDLAMELESIKEEISLLEETMELLGEEAFDMISQVCEEVLKMYEEKERVEKKLSDLLSRGAA